MFPKHDICTGTFGLSMKLYTICKAGSERRLNQCRSYAQGSFVSVAERGPDFRRKRLSSPQQIVTRSIINMKGMNVMLRRLRPVPINRWTVLPYCSCWPVFVRASRLDFYLLLSRRYEFNSMLSLFIHDNRKNVYINNVIWLFMLSFILHTLLLLLYTVMMKVCSSWPSSEDHYILREIMFRRTKGFNL